MNISIPVNIRYTPQGCGDYVSYVEILKALGRSAGRMDFSVFFNGSFDSFPVMPSGKMSFFHLPYPHQGLEMLRYFCWLNAVFLTKAGMKKKRAGFFINQNMPWLWRGNSLTRIQDIAFLFFEEYFKKKDLVRLKMDTAVAVKRSDHLIAISETTKKDIVRYYSVPESRITVAYNGVDPMYRRIPKDSQGIVDSRKKYGIDRPYILYTGVLQKRKNLLRLLKAFQIFRDRYGCDHVLVLVGGRGWLFDEVLEYHNSMPEKDQVKFCGRVSDDELLYLYNGADLFVLPSLYEGFGIPLAEAMACGVPAIASNTSSLPEVGGNAALYFDPMSPEEMAESMFRVLNDSGLKAEMIEKGLERAAFFNWDNTASIIIRELEKIS